jgi:hypothetical protein
MCGEGTMPELSRPLSAREITQELFSAYREVALTALKAAELFESMDECSDDKVYRKAIVRDIKVDSAIRRLEDARDLFHEEYTRLRQVYQLEQLYQQS